MRVYRAMPACVRCLASLERREPRSGLPREPLRERLAPDDAHGGGLVACGGRLESEPTLGTEWGADGVAKISYGQRKCALLSGQACYGLPTGPVCTTTCAAEADQLRCDGPEDCPGCKCCPSLTPIGASRAACADTCVPGRGPELCHSSAECKSANGAVCCPIHASRYPGVGACESRCD